jgi:hypothetical protein
MRWEKKLRIGYKVSNLVLMELIAAQLRLMTRARLRRGSGGLT